MNLYVYKDIEIDVIEEDGRYATALPVSEEAVRLFTLTEGKIKIPIDLLHKIFKHDTRPINRINL